MSRPRLRIKFVSSTPATTWLHQFPGSVPVWGDCEFVFDRAERRYDWLLVYDDLPATGNERRKISIEPLLCPRSHTLLVTNEPSSVKIYGNDYTRQFGTVLTSQPEWALPHRDRIFSQPALHWFYGVGRAATLPFDAIAAQPANAKREAASMVYSAKAMRHTLHYHRARFMRELAQQMPEIDLFGRHSARALDDKADCLRDYRYHVAVENYFGPHHWTEKIADPFLGLTLPFYFGCPNLEDYFPPESFVRIDLLDPAGAAAIMREAIAKHEFDRRLSALVEAKRRVLFEYNLFAVAAREIALRHQPELKPGPGVAMLSRHAMRQSSPLTLMRDLYAKLRGRMRHLPGAISGKS